ncbi:MAG: hypothetical protein AB1540_07405 [Bdellovibrionota bacterium]
MDQLERIYRIAADPDRARLVQEAREVIAAYSTSKETSIPFEHPKRKWEDFSGKDRKSVRHHLKNSLPSADFETLIQALAENRSPRERIKAVVKDTLEKAVIAKREGKALELDFFTVAEIDPPAGVTFTRMRESGEISQKDATRFLEILRSSRKKIDKLAVFLRHEISAAAQAAAEKKRYIPSVKTLTELQAKLGFRSKRQFYTATLEAVPIKDYAAYLKVQKAGKESLTAYAKRLLAEAEEAHARSESYVMPVRTWKDLDPTRGENSIRIKLRKGLSKSKYKKLLQLFNLEADPELKNLIDHARRLIREYRAATAKNEFYIADVSTTENINPLNSRQLNELRLRTYLSDEEYKDLLAAMKAKKVLARKERLASRPKSKRKQVPAPPIVAEARRVLAESKDPNYVIPFSSPAEMSPEVTTHARALEDLRGHLSPDEHKKVLALFGQKRTKGHFESKKQVEPTQRSSLDRMILEYRSTKTKAIEKAIVIQGMALLRMEYRRLDWTKQFQFTKDDLEEMAAETVMALMKEARLDYYLAQKWLTTAFKFHVKTQVSRKAFSQAGLSYKMKSQKLFFHQHRVIQKLEALGVANPTPDLIAKELNSIKSYKVTITAKDVSEFNEAMAEAFPKIDSADAPWSEDSDETLFERLPSGAGLSEQDD